MRVYRYTLVAIIMYSRLTAGPDIKIPKTLFSVLQNNSGWELVDSDSSGLTVSTKTIPNRNLAALMVEQSTSLPLSVVSDVVMDVGHYSDFLISAGKMYSEEISRAESSLDGYQYISIDVPFFSDRKYCFRMNRNGVSPEDTLSLVHWYLLNEDGKHSNFLKNTDFEAVYLDHGAGLWMAYKRADGSVIISYRLYMDPGGTIPKFLVDKINQMSIVNIFRDALVEAQKRSLVDYQ